MVVVGSPPPGIPELGRSSLLSFGISLAVAILGLVLTEQCYRRTPSRSRWHVRPLVLAFAAIFGYDVVLYSDAALFRVLDENLWTARGIAQAMTVPLFALTLDRTKNWSFDVVLSRGVVAGSTALLASGAYLVLVATGGFYLRYFGGSWARPLKLRCYLQPYCSWRWSVFPRPSARNCESWLRRTSLHIATTIAKSGFDLRKHSLPVLLSRRGCRAFWRLRIWLKAREEPCG